MKKYLILAVMAAGLSGCTTTKYVEVERIKTDTIYQSKMVHDSIRVTDSVVIQQKGDTIYTDRWHTQWRERLQIDTVYQSRIDSVPVPVEVIKEVPAELTAWQVFRIHAGEIAIVALIVILALYLKRII